MFFALAFAWAWSIWLIGPRVIQRFSRPSDVDGQVILLVVIGACGPSFAALVTRWLAHHDLKACPIWTGWRALIAGLGVGIAALFVTVVAAPSIALVKAPVAGLHWAILLHWSSYGVNYSTFLGGPINEEPGWRGFALPRLQSRYGPVWASIILAGLWAAWHLPLFQFPGWSSVNPWQFLLILTGISFLFTAAANLAKFGVIVAIVLHAFFNTSSGLVNALTRDLPGRNHSILIFTLTIFTTATLLGLAILAWQRRAGERVRALRAALAGETQ